MQQEKDQDMSALTCESEASASPRATPQSSRLPFSSKPPVPERTPGSEGNTCGVAEEAVLKEPRAMPFARCGANVVGRKPADLTAHFSDAPIACPSKCPGLCACSSNASRCGKPDLGPSAPPTTWPMLPRNDICIPFSAEAMPADIVPAPAPTDAATPVGCPWVAGCPCQTV